MLGFQSLPPVLERYELKYTVPWCYVDAISEFISGYCVLDKHSAHAQANDYFYPVNSLYFDTPGQAFLKQRLEGKTQRFNMRVRTYADGSQGPYFLEIKYRPGTVGIIKKYRATAQVHEWPQILTDPGYRVPETDSLKEQTIKELFLRLAISYAIEPKILIQYERRAFISTVDEYARVTLDRNMRCRPQQEYNTLARHDLIHYDNETIYTGNARSEACAILELKCMANAVPYWMLALIKRFELKQQGFSKYLNSSLVSHFDNGDWFMSTDRKSTLLHDYS